MKLPLFKSILINHEILFKSILKNLFKSILINHEIIASFYEQAPPPALPPFWMDRGNAAALTPAVLRCPWIKTRRFGCIQIEGAQ